MMDEVERKRPKNPYRENTVIWSLMEGSLQEQFDGLPGWGDLTKRQIGEVLCVSTHTVTRYIYDIKQRIGYDICFFDGRRRRDDEES